MLEVIITKEELYDKCENVEQLYDGFYYPLLVEYKGLKKQLEVLQQELEQLKEIEKEHRTINGELRVENKELKKQLEEERNKVREYSYKLSNFRCEETYENQQKKFIEFLEHQVKLQEELNDIHLATGFEEILSKYKEVIGSDSNE